MSNIKLSQLFERRLKDQLDMKTKRNKEGRKRFLDITEEDASTDDEPIPSASKQNGFVPEPIPSTSKQNGFVPEPIPSTSKQNGFEYEPIPSTSKQNGFEYEPIPSTSKQNGFEPEPIPSTSKRNFVRSESISSKSKQNGFEYEAIPSTSKQIVLGPKATPSTSKQNDSGLSDTSSVSLLDTPTTINSDETSKPCDDYKKFGRCFGNHSKSISINVERKLQILDREEIDSTMNATIIDDPDKYCFPNIYNNMPNWMISSFLGKKPKECTLTDTINTTTITKIELNVTTSRKMDQVSKERKTVTHHSETRKLESSNITYTTCEIKRNNSFIQNASNNVIPIRNWNILTDNSQVRVRGKEIRTMEVCTSGIITDVIEPRALQSNDGKVYNILGDMESTEDDSLPEEFKHQFASGFPDNWKELFFDLFNETNLGKECISLPSDGDENEAVNNDSDIPNVVYEDSAAPARKKKPINVKIKKEDEDGKTISVILDRKDYSAHKIKNELNILIPNDRRLADWRPAVNKKLEIVVIGSLLSRSNTTLEEKHTSGAIVKRLESDLLLCQNNVKYRLLGQLNAFRQNPEIKNNFQFGFPKNWRQIMKSVYYTKFEKAVTGNNSLTITDSTIRKIPSISPVKIKSEPLKAVKVQKNPSKSSVKIKSEPFKASVKVQKKQAKSPIKIERSPLKSPIKTRRNRNKIDCNNITGVAISRSSSGRQIIKPLRYWENEKSHLAGSRINIVKNDKSPSNRGSARKRTIIHTKSTPSPVKKQRLTPPVKPKLKLNKKLVKPSTSKTIKVKKEKVIKKKDKKRYDDDEIVKVLNTPVRGIRDRIKRKDVMKQMEESFAKNDDFFASDCSLTQEDLSDGGWDVESVTSKVNSDDDRVNYNYTPPLTKMANAYIQKTPSFSVKDTNDANKNKQRDNHAQRYLHKVANTPQRKKLLTKKQRDEQLRANNRAAFIAKHRNTFDQSDDFNNDDDEEPVDNDELGRHLYNELSAGNLKDPVVSKYINHPTAQDIRDSFSEDEDFFSF